MPTRLSSVVITAASRTRPAQRSSERKYGSASRQMVATDETKPFTGASDGLRRRPDRVADADGASQPPLFNCRPPLALRPDISLDLRQDIVHLGTHRFSPR